MFTRAYVSKFEYNEDQLPDGLTGHAIEEMILRTDNLAYFKDADFFTNRFVALEFDDKYGQAKKWQTNLWSGKTITSKPENVVILRPWKVSGRKPKEYINYYTHAISQINKAIMQHVKGDTLIAHINARTPAERDMYERVFSGFDGVVVSETKQTTSDKLDTKSQPLDITQFEVTAKYTDLENLKHEFEKDCALRLGIIHGTEKTHIVMRDVENSESLVDLLNAYELKDRQKFFDRYNQLTGRNITVKLHEAMIETPTEGVTPNVAQGE